VIWLKRPLVRPFVASIKKNHKRSHLGYFSTKVEAQQAYDRAARQLFKSFARPNFSQEAA
jgi:hypothetical protein